MSVAGRAATSSFFSKVREALAGVKRCPGAAPAHDVATGLGADIDKHLKCSPTLSNNIATLQKSGWTIVRGPAGGGSFTDRGKKTITVDSSESDLAVIQTLAHESGHALYTPDPYVPAKGLDREQFVARNVERDLKDEGEATLMNVQVNNETIANCKEDIGVAGAQAKKYKEIGAKFSKPADRDKAREEIGKVFAEGEHPSNDKNKTYYQYYREPYDDYWDTVVDSPPERP